MINNNRFSEGDLQDYALGRFEGDKNAMEKYLSENASASKLVKDYKAIFIMLASEPQVTLSFKLSDKVLSTIQARRLSKVPARFSLVHYFLTGILIIAVILTYNHFNFADVFSIVADTGLLVISIALVIAFTIGFYFVEFKQKQKRFAE